MEKKNKKLQAEEVTTINELAVMMRDSFQGAQDYMDKKFDAIDQKFEQVDEKFEKVDKRFNEVVKQINQINLNAVDVVRQEDFDKLETRVVKLEHKGGVSVK